MKRLPLFILGAVLIALFAVGSIQVYANRKAEEKVKELFSRLGIEERASYGDVSYSLLNGITEVKGVEIKTDKGTTHAERMVITKLSDTDIEFEIEGIRADDKEFKKFEREMKELGYEEVFINTRLSASLYDESKEFLLRDFSFEMPRAFRVSLNLSLLGVDRELIEELAELDENSREEVNKVAQKLGSVYMRGFKLTLSDQGILNRLIEREAKTRETTPDMVREEILRDMKKNLSTGGTEFERSLIGAVSKFINEGGALVLMSEPKEPVSFQELVFYTLVSVQTRDIKPLTEKLNLKISHYK